MDPALCRAYVFLDKYRWLLFPFDDKLYHNTDLIGRLTLVEDLFERGEIREAQRYSGDSQSELRHVVLLGALFLPVLHANRNSPHAEE